MAQGHAVLPPVRQWPRARARRYFPAPCSRPSTPELVRTAGNAHTMQRLHAGYLASVNRGECFHVYFNGEALFVTHSAEAPPPNATILCIAQHHSSGVVQVRFSGACLRTMDAPAHRAQRPERPAEGGFWLRVADARGRRQTALLTTSLPDHPKKSCRRRLLGDVKGHSQTWSCRIQQIAVGLAKFFPTLQAFGARRTPISMMRQVSRARQSRRRLCSRRTRSAGRS